MSDNTLIWSIIIGNMGIGDMGLPPDKDVDRHKISAAMIPEKGNPLPTGNKFRAWVEIAIVYDLTRLGNRIRVQAYELSTQHIGLNTRHMMHIDTPVVIMIHKIDSKPTVLYGAVYRCEYAYNGMHNVIVKFEEMPETLWI